MELTVTKNVKAKSALSALAVVVSGLTASATAQSRENVSIEAGMSALGFPGIYSIGYYVAPTIQIAPRLHLRTAMYFGSVSDTFDVDGSEIDGKPVANSVAFMGDYYIGDLGFRLSGGVSVGAYKFEGTTTTLTIEDIDYNANFTAKVEQDRNVAPVFAVGYARDLGSNFGVVAEAGARITSLEISTTGQEALDAADRAQFEDDLAQANRDLSKIKVLPFVTLGAVFRF